MGLNVKPRVSIIFVNWNNSDETIECLDSLKGIKYPNFNVVIIENNSSDNSLERLNKVRRQIQDYQIIILRNSDNLGYAGGNNTGINYALQSGAEYILLLNSDTRVDSLFLDELVKEAKSEKEVGIFAPIIYFYYEPHIVWFGGNTDIRWSKMDKAITSNLFLKKSPQDLYSVDVNFISGCAMFLRAEAVRQVGVFDERFFLYFEDADLSLRMKTAGWRLRSVPTSRIWHKVSVTTLGKLGSSGVHYYNTRNILLLSAKHAPIWMISYRPLWAAYTLAKQGIKIIIGRNRKVSRAIAQGIFDYYRGRFGKAR